MSETTVGDREAWLAAISELATRVYEAEAEWLCEEPGRGSEIRLVSVPDGDYVSLTCYCRRWVGERVTHQLTIDVADPLGRAAADRAADDASDPYAFSPTKGAEE